jgi:peptidyl-prolyl cis-trans isomerase D
MTMLDRMRRHKNWLKWSLFLVVVAFVMLYIPSFLQDRGGASSTSVVATVEGQDITVNRFRRAYNQQINAYRNAYGGNIDERLLRQLGVEQRVVQQLIEEEATLAEAKRQGIWASDAEVRARILALPAFQENGQFIGDARYRQILDAQNPPIRVNEFEEDVRRSIVVEKLQGALTDWITVADADVDSEFNRRNEKVKLAVVSFPADKFKDGVSVSDDEIAKHFEASKEQYRVPEKRKVKYALVDQDAIRQRTTVSMPDVQSYYDSHRSEYSMPERVQASHILLKTAGKDDAAVKKQAEDVLAKLKAGADFAEMAKKVSEDESNASKGGDLGFFEREGPRAMVKEFSDAAFALEPNQLSGVVKTEFGYHIIKVTAKQTASTSTPEQVRPQIEDAIKNERATAEAQRIADGLVGKLSKPEMLDTVGKASGLVVGETPFFSRQEPIVPGLGAAGEVVRRAFEMKPGEVSEALRTPQGLVFVALTGTEESKLPTLEEVKARVRDDVSRTKAIDAARQKATALVAQLKSGDFTAAAKSAGLETKTTDLITRGQPIPDVGASGAIDTAAFALPAGGVSDAITTDTGAVIVKVLEKKLPTPDEIKAGRDTVKTQLIGQQRQRFFAAYMAKARERMTIRSNPQVLAQVIG